MMTAEGCETQRLRRVVAFMRMKQACFAVAVLLGLTQLAQAQNFNQLVGFGDSATDTGWFTGATSGPHSTGFAPFDLSIAAALADGGNGHWTGPGLGNAQILAAHFGLSANAVGTLGGTNFAIGNDVDFLVPPGFFPPTATGNLFPNPLPGDRHPDQQLSGFGEWPRQSQCALFVEQRRKRHHRGAAGIWSVFSGRSSLSSG
jgi:hypothetical protein